MWGVKMQVFKSQKVLAVGQTSGSSGWVKILTSITMRGDGLSIAFGNPKKDNGQFDLPRERGKSTARRKRNLVPWMCGCHPIENFWSIFLSRQTILDLNRYGKEIWDTNPTFSFPLSLILRERGHHELSIVLPANFSAATGDFPCRGKTHCAWNATHRIRCHT